MLMRVVPGVLILGLSLSVIESAQAKTPSPSDAKLITAAVLHSTPRSIKVVTIFQEGYYALAQWQGTAGKEAGGALLVDNRGSWSVIKYGGGEFPASYIVQLGIPPKTANALVGNAKAAGYYI